MSIEGKKEEEIHLSLELNLYERLDQARKKTWPAYNEVEMDTFESLREIVTWQKTLGLLPVPLFDNSLENRFVLLNGTQGNFCLDIGGNVQTSPDSNRDIAWSSNVGHYVSIVDDKIEVQRWDQRFSSLERYSLRSVYSNLEKFHQYLEQNSPKQELSVIAHSIKSFRRIRAVLGESVTGGDALKAFLYFLSCAAENKSRGQLDLDQWNLSPDVLEIVSSIREGDWDALLREYLEGRPIDRLTPDVSLILRHASGQLFQEAHYEAMFVNPGQLMFTGFLPNPVDIKGLSDKSVGLHFTPPALARTLVEESLRVIDLSSGTLTVFDPACGSGEFLRETLRQLKLQQFTGNVTLRGWDISETACAMARYELGWELRGIQFPVEIQIECRDSLSLDEAWPSTNDIIIMNPPFVSWQRMDTKLKDQVRQILSNHAGARPDLSHVFLLLAANAITQNGVIGTIIPASILDGISSEKIRKYLGEQLNTVLVARLGSHQLFPGAMVDAAFYVSKRGIVNTEPMAFWADYRANSNSAGLRALRRLRYYSTNQSLPIIEDGFTIYSFPQLGNVDDSWTPRPYGSWKLLSSIDRTTTIRDLFDIRQGIRTGNKKVFLISSDKWQNLPEHEQKFFRPSIVNEFIRFGYIRLVSYAFFPYGDNLALDSEEQLRQVLPNYYHDYLLPNKSKLLRRSGIDPQKWWLLTRHRTMSLEKNPKIVSTYFGDAGSFGFDTEGNFLVVEGSAWITKEEKYFDVLLRGAGYAYLALLNSKIFSQLLSASSSHVGGGQWDLSKQYIDQIPLPNFYGPNLDAGLIKALAEIGRGIYAGLPVNEKEKEDLVKRAYKID